MVAGLNDTGFDPIAAGGVIDYAVDIANNGSDAAPATTLTFNIPAGTTLVGTSGDLTNCTPSSGAGALTMTCDVPEMASGAHLFQTVQVSSTSAGVITVDTEMPTSVGATTDSNTANNVENELTTILAGADIGLNLTADPTAASGARVDFVLEAINNGPYASNEFTIQFPVPTGIVNITPAAGCTYVAPNWVCNISGPVASGATITRTFSGQIAAASGSTITASASVLGQSPADPIAANNNDTASIAVSQGTDVAISKTRSPGGGLRVGDSVTFTLAASYTGDAPTGLVINDNVPANYSITAVNATGGWNCSIGGQNVSCTNPGGGSAGSAVSLGSVEIVADVVSAGSALNTATISVTAPAEQNLANNTATDGGVMITDRVVDLHAHKYGPDPHLAVVGNSYDFFINVSNDGNAPFWGTLEMHDTLPAGLDLDSLSLAGWTCSPTSGVGPLTVDCTRVYTEASPLSAGATTPAVTFHTTASATGLLSNQLTVGSTDGNVADTNPANDNTSYDIQAELGVNSANIGAIKTASPDPVVAGEVLTYTLEITNPDATTAQNIQVKDLIANLISSGSGATGEGFISASIVPGVATGASCSDSASGTSARNLSCTIASLPTCTASSNCPVITVQVRPGGDGGTYTNTFSAISQITPDPDLTDNQGSASYVLDPRADVTVIKTATPDPVLAGQNLIYVVTAQNINNGLSQAENVQIVDTLPDGLTFVSATGATCTGLTAGDVTSSSTLTCDMGTISNGGQRAVTITMRPNNVTQGTDITNNATVSTTTVETDVTNNATSITVHVDLPQLDLQINKTDSVDPVAISDDTVYTISVANNGPSASENVVLTDTLPASLLSFQSYTVSGSGVCGTVPAVDSVGGTVQCSWPVLLAGDSETVTVTMRGIAKGTVPNSAVVSSDEVLAGWEGPAANNAITEDTTVRTKTDVQLTKTSSAAVVELMEDFSFTLLVDVNTGVNLAEADGVVVTDNLPANMELTGAPSAVVNSGSSTVNSCTGAAGSTSFSCNFGTMSSGAQIAITVPVQIVAATSDPYTLTNTATVTTTSLDVDPTNNSDSDTVGALFSSLAGTVFRDFADDAEMNGADTGISGVTMTLTGTDFDGNPVSRTTTTDGNGDYIFTFLPRGTYRVNRGAVSEARLVDSDALTPAPSEGGTYNGFTEINTIPLLRATDAVEYNFALIPMAGAGIQAIPEVFPPFVSDGGTTTTMLASDLLEGDPATLDNVTLRVLNEDPGVTLDPTTTLITLAPGYPAGEYHVEYEICSIAEPTLCDTAIETVVQSNVPGIEKTTPKDVVNRGDIVPYTITVTNSNNFTITPTDIVDILPGHFLPIADTAQLNGVDFDVDVSGLRVTWPNVDIPANGSVTATISARVLNGAPAGEHVNQAWLYDGPTGDLIAGAAVAPVRILPEFVFDCSDVIGVVFDDQNANGYKDGAAQDPQAMHGNGITDQSYYGGKLGKLGPLLPKAERGIPGVRLVSPDGTIVTTDENGLYSVPCAALPAEHGSNFILKLDERSLPSGYRPTTENPRVVRLTAGMMAEVNFGAAIGKVVRVDLIEAAFVAGEGEQADLSSELKQGIRTLVEKFADEPVIVRLAWHVAANADASAVQHGRARMQLVETRLRQEWAAAGHVPLRVETTIIRAGQ